MSISKGTLFKMQIQTGPKVGAPYACLKTHRPFIYKGEGCGETMRGEVIELAPEGMAKWMHPWPAHLEKMAEGFEALAKNQNNRVAFHLPKVMYDKCGTVACHAGWAAVILKVGKHYQFGANALAQFLNAHWLEGKQFARWAHENPHLWGRTAEFLGESTADLLFQSSGHTAFGFEQPGQCTLSDIAKRYREVAERVKAEWPA